MDNALHVNKNQPSFIPKHTGQNNKHKTFGNVFFTVSLILLFVTIIAWGGFLLYKAELTSKRMVLEEELESKTKAAVDQGEVDDFRTLAARISVTEELLDSHVVITPIIKLLETLTLTGSVRFNDFSLTSINGYVVSLTGKAKNFRSLAYQEFLFSEEPSIVAPVFDSFSIEETTGDVNFSVTFSVNPDLIKYANTVGFSSISVE